MLDTNVLSQRIKSRPDARVAAWLNNAIARDVFLSVVTILEIRTGIELMAVGTKRTKLEAWLECDVRRFYSGGILPVTEAIAIVGGRLIAERRKASETPEHRLPSSHNSTGTWVEGGDAEPEAL